MISERFYLATKRGSLLNCIIPGQEIVVTDWDWWIPARYKEKIFHLEGTLEHFLTVAVESTSKEIWKPLLKEIGNLFWIQCCPCFEQKVSIDEITFKPEWFSNQNHLTSNRWRIMIELCRIPQSFGSGEVYSIFSLYFIDLFLWHIQLGKIAVFCDTSLFYPLCRSSHPFFSVLCEMSISK